MQRAQQQCGRIYAETKNKVRDCVRFRRQTYIADYRFYAPRPMHRALAPPPRSRWLVGLDASGLISYLRAGPSSGRRIFRSLARATRRDPIFPEGSSVLPFFLSAFPFCSAESDSTGWLLRSCHLCGLRFSSVFVYLTRHTQCPTKDLLLLGAGQVKSDAVSMRLASSSYNARSSCGVAPAKLMSNRTLGHVVSHKGDC